MSAPSGNVTWVEYIADLMRRGEAAATELSAAWVEMYRQYGNEAHMMRALAEMRAREAEQAGEPVQAGLW